MRSHAGCARSELLLTGPFPANASTRVATRAVLTFAGVGLGGGNLFKAAADCAVGAPVAYDGWPEFPVGPTETSANESTCPASQ